MVRFATSTISSDGIVGMTILNQSIANVELGIYGWLIKDEIVRIGSSKGSLGGRAKFHQRWIELRLTGKCRLKDSKRLAKETADAKRWQAELAGGETADLWGRAGTVLQTSVGTLNLYLSEENALLERHKPRLNNSHFR